MPIDDYSERDIEDILLNFPYLIDSRIKHSFIDSRQFVFTDGTRLDLKFEGPNEIFVIEIKKGVIDKYAFYQLTHYINELYSVIGGSKAIIGFIIGNNLIDDVELNNLLKKYPFEVKIKILERDIPLKIKFCKKCRKANGHQAQYCKYDSHNKFFI